MQLIIDLGPQVETHEQVPDVLRAIADSYLSDIECGDEGGTVSHGPDNGYSSDWEIHGQLGE